MDSCLLLRLRLLLHRGGLWRWLWRWLWLQQHVAGMPGNWLTDSFTVSFLLLWEAGDYGSEPLELFTVGM